MHSRTAWRASRRAFRSRASLLAERCREACACTRVWCSPVSRARTGPVEASTEPRLPPWTAIRTPVVTVAASAACASAPASHFAPPALPASGPRASSVLQHTRRGQRSAERDRLKRGVRRERTPRPREQRLHGGDRCLLTRGDLAIAASFESMTDERIALAGGKLVHRSHQPADPLALLHSDSYGLIGGAVPTLLDLVRRPGGASRVDGRVANDREQPRPRMLGAGAGRDRPVGIQERLLDDVLGQACVPTQLSRGEPRELAPVALDELLEHVLLSSSTARRRRMLLRPHQNSLPTRSGPPRGFSDGLDVVAAKRLRSQPYPARRSCYRDRLGARSAGRRRRGVPLVERRGDPLGGRGQLVGFDRVRHV